jgi:CDP-6-deoxy-D-xylo-4-hexulose-3-dehydrase
MNTNQLSMSEYCSKFEHEFSKWQNTTFSVLVNSGASANLLLLQTLKNINLLKNNDKIGFSSVTWATNVMPIIQLGMLPIPIDIKVSTLNIDIDYLIEIIEKENINCLFITNALGFCADLEKIKDICDYYKIILLEDNCESIGTKLKGKKIGNFGLASTFSFYVAHQLSTIEGGMICTKNEYLYDNLIMARANGWDRNLLECKQTKLRHSVNIDEFYSKFYFYDLGMNVRPTEIIGFLGYSQIKYLDEIIKKRHINFIKIYSRIVNNNDLIKLDWDHYDLLSSFSIPVICKNKQLRDKYLKRFQDNGIECRPIIAGNITRNAFFKKYINNKYNLINANFIHDNGFYCPNYPEMSDKDIKLIKECLK